MNNSIRISVLSDKQIKCIANNKLKNNETLNYNTLNPQRGGLFCENIFGTNKLTCKCKKINFHSNSILYCKFCKSQVSDPNYNHLLNSYINLKDKFINPLFYNSNYIPILLGISKNDIKNILYNNYYIVIFKNSAVVNKKVLKFKDYIKLKNDKVIAETGFKGLELALANINVNEEIFNLNRFFENNKLKFKNSVYKKNLIKYKILNKIKFNNLCLNNLFIKNLFIMHPLFRPIMKLDSGSITSSDLNVIYRKLIYRSLRLNLLKKHTNLDILINKEKLAMQNSLNSLFLSKNDNEYSKSILSVIKGKFGLFRYNLLGKRVDFSARSVIVSEPNLRLDECFIPELIALEIFKPFIYNKLLNLGYSFKESKIIIEEKSKFVIKILNKIIKNQFVLLNRAPTLHRLGIQSFKILLTKEKVIKIHPLVCTAFNADFDGDQMAVHIALSKESLCEYKILMNSSRNILNPSNGQYLILPTQDILLGLFYSSILNKKKKKFFLFFNIQEVKFAYNKNLIKLNTRIFVKIKRLNCNRIFETTFGRLLVYNVFPGYLDFNFINKLFIKKNVNNIFKLITDKYGKNLVSNFADNIMKLGFYFSTISGISLCIDDMIVIKNKNRLISNTRNIIKMYNNDYLNGLLSNLSRKKKILDLWQITIDLISEICIKNLFLNSYYNKNYKKNFINTLSVIMDSGSRGSESQIKQICAVRGFIFYKNKGLLDLPVLSNLKEGLNAIEYFFFSHSSRKVLADTSLKTSNAGYLTRKLIESSIDVVINKYDCLTSDGINFQNLTNNSEYIESIYERVHGRILLKDLIINKTLLIKKNTLLTNKEINLLKTYNVNYIKIRSPITCGVNIGLCQLCYGLDLSKNKLVSMGECVGIIAAQAIGEPGTQLTMRTFHSGGAFNYKKKQNSFISNNDGILIFSKSLKFIKKKNFNIVLSKTGKVYIKNDFDKIVESIDIPYASYLYKNDNSKIKKGDLICKWDLDYNYVLSDINGFIILENFIENYNFIKKRDNFGKNYYEILDLKFSVKNKPYLKIVNKKKSIDLEVFPGYNILFKDKDIVKKGDRVIKIIKELKTENLDITGGLPKVTELFEARVPKNKSIIAPFDGNIRRRGDLIYLENSNNSIKYNIKNKSLLIDSGNIYFGDKLTEGIIDPHDILELYGVDGIFNYYTSEVKFIYSSQGVSINDKHIEIILKQMLKKVIIINPGKSDYKKGEIIDKYTILQLNKLNKNIVFREILYGITKSSLNSNSFLSKMSFQNTNSVLMKSSLLREKNELFSIKENTMLGKLIPAGTGFYNKFYDYKSKNKFW